jgi:hypothetical protein
LEIPVDGYEWSDREYGSNLAGLDGELEWGVEYICRLERPVAPPDFPEEDVETYFPKDGVLLVITPRPGSSPPL